MRQQPNKSGHDFAKRQKELANILKLAGGSHLFHSPQLSGGVLDDGTTKLLDQDEIDKDEQKYFAVHLIQCADPVRYNELWKSLVDAANKGRDEYPKTRAAALDLLLKTSGETDSLATAHPGGQGNSRNSRRGNGRFGRGNRGFRGGQGGHQFYQGKGKGRNDQSVPSIDEHIAGNDGKIHEGVMCYSCNLFGHYSDQCPTNGGRGGSQNMQVDFCLAQKGSSDWMEDVDLGSLLLDTGSTFSGVRNSSKLVSNVRSCTDDEVLTASTNGGTVVYNKIGDLNFLPLKVYVNDNSLVDVLSMKDVLQIPDLYVTMDSGRENAIFVHFKKRVFRFKEVPEGLYLFDGKINSTVANNSTNAQLFSYSSFLQLVKDNKKQFSLNEIKGADHARRQQQQMMWPGDNFFRHIIHNNLTNNNKVQVPDIDNGLKIYGPLREMLEGKMTRTNPTKATFDRQPVPTQIAEKFRNGVQLEFDLLFVNRLPFLHSRSQKIDFRTIKLLPSREKGYIKEACKRVVQKYKKRGFNVTDYHVDNEFAIDGLEELLEADKHVSAADERIGG